MTTIKCSYDFVVTGQLQQYDYGNDLVRFIFKPDIEIEIRNVSYAMIQTLMNLGLTKISNATINFVTGKIDLHRPEQK